MARLLFNGPRLVDYGLVHDDEPGDDLVLRQVRNPRDGLDEVRCADLRSCQGEEDGRRCREALGRNGRYGWLGFGGRALCVLQRAVQHETFILALLRHRDRQVPLQDSELLCRRPRRALGAACEARAYPRSIRHHRHGEIPWRARQHLRDWHRQGRVAHSERQGLLCGGSL